MTKLESLEQQVQSLSPEELAAFRAWFLEHDWKQWDAELEKDVAEGKLDRFADEALEEHRLGKTRSI